MKFLQLSRKSTFFQLLLENFGQALCRFFLKSALIVPTVRRAYDAAVGPNVEAFRDSTRNKIVIEIAFKFWLPLC